MIFRSVKEEYQVLLSTEMAVIKIILLKKQNQKKVGITLNKNIQKAMMQRLPGKSTNLKTLKTLKTLRNK
ncbi:Uncharacterised protein [Mycobacteroides abscessus subsp. abscessus]|nr:Uncharacterised protein [Mycobacteroides abscessus subsp. abscessus]